jgi:sulfite exporter TauE/SafE
MMTTVLAGAVLGLAGSAHCAGMCGPLLLIVLGRGRAPGHSAWRTALLYHLGRISMYTLLAVPAGFAGRELAGGGAGRLLAVVAGGLLLLAATGSGMNRWLRPFSQAWSTAVIRAGTKATTLTRRYPHAGYAVLGLVNGVLPCGLVYAAVTAAAASGTVAGSIAFMAGFGAGTVPVLMVVTLAGASIPSAVRRRLRFAGPSVLVLAGLLLVMRGVIPNSPSAQHHRSDASPARPLTPTHRRLLTPHP